MKPLISLMVAAFSVAACAPKDPTSVRPVVSVPPLDSEASTPCPAIRVDRNPKVAVVEHRRALAICEERRALAVQCYIAVQKVFGVQP